nr:protein of unknown function [Ralstonia solanacearum]
MLSEDFDVSTWQKIKARIGLGL